MSLSVEPTTSCNLRCPECPSGLRSFTRPTGMLDPDRLSDLLLGPEGLARELVYLNLYFQGEPYLHPGMDDLVRVGKQAGLYVSTSTNAHFIDGDRARSLVNSGIDRLIISIDGADQDAYSSYRVGGKLDKVLAGTRALLDARPRRKPHPTSSGSSSWWAPTSTSWANCRTWPLNTGWTNSLSRPPSSIRPKMGTRS